MTIIATFPKYHLEEHNVLFAAVPAGGVGIAIIILDRPGRFMGGSAAVNLAEFNIDVSAPGFHTTAIARLNFGDAITQVRAFIQNNSGVVQDISCHYMLWIGT